MDTHKGLFPLHQAAAVGDAPAIRSCLAGGSPPHIDTRNRRGNTALMLAAETGQVEALRAQLPPEVAVEALALAVPAQLARVRKSGHPRLYHFDTRVKKCLIHHLQ